MRQPVPFGKYLLLDRISVGGMAEVFKAKSYGVEGFEKIIAIKRILPTMGEDRDFIKMFIDEAKIAGQLAHANICQIFELGRIDGSHFIAMEYIWGKDLLQIQNRLRKIKQPMPIAMACFSIAKVLEGLDYAHRKRDPLGRPLEIVHRDCSPQNVLVSYEGEVKVIDFGIAKATSRNSRTMAGVLKGKFGYMSPEQVRGLPLDRRSDIFALGTMLYECLTGDRLFQGETDFSTLEKVRNVDIRPPREINPNIPRAVEAVILKALAKDVDERYQWCSEMLADLQAFLMSQDVVFTAKSLSSWLKEVFSTEIDRERQLLEQYKRVGRDGLVNGVPAAESKADVVENFGLPGPVEGDPTTLGGPNFDDLDHPAEPAEVGPAPGSPAARGGPLDTPEDDDGESFGEEAPTEIFGEIDHGANPAAPDPGRAPTASPQHRPPKLPPGRAPTSRGEAPLPGMASGPGGPASQRAPMAAMPGSQASGPQDMGYPGAPGLAAHGYANPPGHSAPYPSYQQPPGYPSAGPPPGFPPPSHGAVNGPHGDAMHGHGSQPVAMGTPMAIPVAPSGQVNGGPGPSNPQNHTLIGQPVPHGLPNYNQGYPPQHQQPQPPYGYPGQPGQPPMIGHEPGQMQGHGQPGQMQGHGQPGQMPGQGQHGQMPPSGMYGHPSGMYGHPGQHQGMPGQPPGINSPYPQVQLNNYAQQQNPYNPPSPPVEQPAPLEDKKRSPIFRDVAIGVAIAALVLGGFLAVKYIFYGSKDAAETAETTDPAAASYAKVRLAMAGGTAAELFIDDKKIATVGDKQEIPVKPGTHKVKLVGSGGARCEKDMNLDAGKVTTLECLFPAAATGSDTTGAAPATGASSDPAAGSAASATGAAPASAGSAAGAATPAGATAGSQTLPADTKPADAKPADAKPADAKPADAKPAAATNHTTDKLPSEDKPAAHAADKPLASKPPGSKPADAKLTTKPADKPVRSKPAPPVDDDLGSFRGGTKPGDKAPASKSSRSH